MVGGRLKMNSWPVGPNGAENREGFYWGRCTRAAPFAGRTDAPSGLASAAAYLCLLAAGIACGPRCLAEEPETCRLSLPADEAFQQGQGAWDVRLHDGGAVGLYDRVLVEDDGPGIGDDAPWRRPNRAPTTEIAGDTRVKKVLHVAHHQAKEAWLYAPAGVAIEINGRPIDASPGAPVPQVPVSLLKDGDNEVVLYCRDGAGKPSSTPRRKTSSATRRSGRTALAAVSPAATAARPGCRWRASTWSACTWCSTCRRATSSPR